MKIAMMTNSYKPYIAGVPISIERLSDSLMEAGHQVTIYAPTYEEQQESKNIFRYKSVLQGVCCGFSVPNSLDRRVEKNFAKGGFDIIHVHHPMLIGWTALYLSHKYHVPIVFTYHTRYEQYLHYIKASFLKNMIPDYVRFFVTQCDLVFAPAELMRNYLESMETNTDIAVLPTGLPKDYFQIDNTKSLKIRNRLNGDKKYLFCTTSRLAKEKNIGFLLESLAERKNRQGSDFHFMIIGEGPEKESLITQAADLNLSEEVIFVGKIPNLEVKEYCRAADLFLFASTSETQGIVLLESMAAGTPVLAVKAPGVEDIVANGHNGYMTSMSNVEFAQRLDSLLLGNEIDLLTEGAKNTAALYHTEKVAEAALLHYNRVLYRKYEHPTYPTNKKMGMLFN